MHSMHARRVGAAAGILICPSPSGGVQGLMSAIDELHARKDNKHRVRMLFSSLTYESCQVCVLLFICAMPWFPSRPALLVQHYTAWPTQNSAWAKKRSAMLCVSCLPVPCSPESIPSQRTWCASR